MKLTQREVILLFLLGSMLVVFLGASYLVAPGYEAAQASQERLEALRSEQVMLSADVAMLGIIDAQIGEQYDQGIAATARFSYDIEPPAVDHFLRALLESANLRADAIDISRLQTANADFYSRRTVIDEADRSIPVQRLADLINGVSGDPGDETVAPSDLMYSTLVSMSVAGADRDIVRFVDSLYNSGSRALVVEKFSLSYSPLTAEGLHTATLTLRLFAVPTLN